MYSVDITFYKKHRAPVLRYSGIEADSEAEAKQIGRNHASIEAPRCQIKSIKVKLEARNG